MEAEMNGAEYKKGGVGAWYILVVCSLLYMISLMDRQVFSTVLEPMKKDIGLSDGEAGILLSILLVFMALFAIPAGIIVDRWSRKKAIGLMAIIWSAATFMTALGQNMWGVFIPRSVTGIGEAGLSSGANAMITASFPDTLRSRAMSVFYMCSPIGIMLGSILGGYLSAHFGGWRIPFYIFAIPGIILGIMAFFFRDYKSVQTDESTGKNYWQNIAYVFKVPSMIWAVLITGVFSFVSYGILFWVPAYMMRSMGIKEDTAGLILGGLAVLGVIGTIVGGVISDIWYKKKPEGRLLVGVIAGPLTAVSGISGVWLLNIGHVAVGITLMGIYSFGVTLYLPTVTTAVQEVVHPSTKGLAQSMNVLIGYLVAAPAPALVGAISQALGGGASGLMYGMIAVSIVALLAIPCVLKCASHYPKDMEKIKHMKLQEEK